LPICNTPPALNTFRPCGCLLSQTSCTAPLTQTHAQHTVRAHTTRQQLSERFLRLSIYNPSKR
jgi:hypothetical protein